MKEALLSKDLLGIVQRSQDPIQAKTQLLEAFIESAKEAKVPLRQPPGPKQRSEAIRSLFRRQVSILKKLRSRQLSKTGKEELQGELDEIKKQLHLTNMSEALEEETRVAEQIKKNPKKFYAHANKFRKLKTKIGPLQQIRNGATEYM